ncbi:MAG TPA: hypothetical protein VGM05_09560 [Planctomycetaceae bacterium]
MSESSFLVAGMVLAVVAGAFPVWLTIRIINRRECWAIRTAAALAVTVAAVILAMALLWLISAVP